MSRTENRNSRLPRALYRAAQVRELDRIAIEEHGIPGEVLMERAGEAAFRVLRERWPEARRISVVCGIGNNGGDGYVIARRAREAGLEVAVHQLGNRSNIKGDALTAMRHMEASGVRSGAANTATLGAADVLVDAVFGTGLGREVAGEYADALVAINRSGAPVLAIDIPSGLAADTGQVLGVAVRADASVTFIGLKRGMFTGQGRAYAGKVVFDDLSVPAAVYAGIEPEAQCITSSCFDNVMGRRSAAAHKGKFGHVLVLGGDHGFAGAARMAGEAALRVGAGLVSIATRPRHAATIGIGRPELMCHAVDSAQDIAPLLDRATVIALGPGLGQSAWAQSLLTCALEADRPLVVDADALNLVAGSDLRHPRWILTPHPGEAGRLLGVAAIDVEAGRFQAVARIVERYRGVCVLKGAGTLVSGEGGITGVCDAGNPGMASGGMGDVLSGVIAGLVAQGLDLEPAAAAGVCLHAAAGDRAAAGGGQRGMLAGDLMAHLRRLADRL